jgi:hypothetical protein
MRQSVKLGLALYAIVGTGACDRKATQAPTQAPAPQLEPVALGPVSVSPEEKWGVRPVSLRPTLGGKMLDFRYKVVDADKARPLFDRKMKPYLYDPMTGIAEGMPDDSQVGSLRASLRNPPIQGRLYYVLFSNGDGAVRRGKRVSVVMGSCIFDDLLVQ